MSILVIGATGFLGRHLMPALPPDSIGLSSQDFDLAKGGTLPDCDTLIIAGAVTDTRLCEEDPSTHAINVDGPLRIARELRNSPCKIVYFSSDYVFDGKAGPYSDQSPTSPSIAYGRHKAEVESRLPKAKPNSLILRLSRLYGSTPGEFAFINAIAKSIPGRAATDQVFCPTHVDDVVRGLLALLRQDATGLLNLCAPEAWSRYDIACALADDPADVTPISLAELPGLAHWPRDTRMTCSPLAESAVGEFRDVRNAIAKVPKYPNTQVPNE
jgi:dTDP-4-dehydrorhamnose reductase